MAYRKGMALIATIFIVCVLAAAAVGFMSGYGAGRSPDGSVVPGIRCEPLSR